MGIHRRVWREERKNIILKNKTKKEMFKSKLTKVDMTKQAYNHRA